MREEILNNLNNPKELEKLYRSSKNEFSKSFHQLYPEIKENTAAQIWHERLSFENEAISWGSHKELIFVLAAALIAGFIAKIPDFFNIEEEYYYSRHIGFIFLPLLAVWFAWKEHLKQKQVIIIGASFIISALYINLLPDNNKSDSIIMACIHLPLFLWSVTGFAFVGNDLHNNTKRLDYLRYNGDMVVLTALIFLAGGILSFITVGLFSIIEINIQEFYFRYIAVWGASAAPVVATYLVQINPQLVNKVSPVIAKVFTPLVFIMLVIYMLALIGSGKDPYNDREFLFFFNMLLIGVMALIFFSIAEITKNKASKFGMLLLLGLAVVTIIINGIALSAILFRISSMGITPNRFVITGGNTLILINLFMITYGLFKALKNQHEITRVEKSIAVYLPVYVLWTMIVSFIIPLLFGFK
ncbi:MAG TPA: hypothetical protein PKC24_15070 [Cyclobacteriaceae bacterium]|nr:hypothetical protein [Cyclobacteriaceae bacterium]